MRGSVGLASIVAAAIWSVGLRPSAAEPPPPAIADVQQALAERGYDVGRPDGRWGVRTERALQLFQLANGIPPTGILDATTLRRLAPKKADLRAEMARKPSDSKGALLARSTAETVTLYRLARTGIGSCKPELFDQVKLRERLRGKFGERFGELNRIIESVADREQTGLAFLDEGFRARTCDAWVATARSAGLAPTLQPAATVAPSSTTEPEAPPRPMASMAPKPSAETAVPTTASLAPVAAASTSPKPTAGPNVTWTWGFLGAASSLTGFMLWRRGRRSPASAAAEGGTAPFEAASVGSSVHVEQRSVAMRSPPSDLAERLAAHNTAVREAIHARTPATATTPEKITPIDAIERTPDAVAIASTDPVPIPARPLGGPEPVLPTHPEPTGTGHLPDEPTFPTSPLAERVAAHNSAVREAIRSNPPSIVPASISANPAAAPPSEPTSSDRIAERTSAAVEAIRSPAQSEARTPPMVAPIPRPAPEPVRPITDRFAAATAWYPGMEPKARGEWVPCGETVTIAGLAVPGGLIWVGGSLPCRGGQSRNENCLIDPKLTVATKPDVSGQYMSYWPSYSDIPPSSRRAYLDWLAGPRNDPAAYIGYVFLYFYGLERRLMLDDAASDRDVVRAEVERLLSVYGGNHSFRRYATELLSAEAVRRGGAEVDPVIDHDIAGFEVPLGIKIALGQRVRDGRPIEPDLLLAFVRTHPDTSLRTPARRASAELRDLFVAEVARTYPNGVKVGGASRIRKLTVTYRAASDTFETDVLPKSLGLPDITGLAEPLGSARAMLDACTARLDAYSRDLGKSPGLTPTLATLGKLPLEIRLDRVAKLPGDPLGTLRSLAAVGEPVPVHELGSRVGLPDHGTIDKGRLREWSALLARLGFGLTCDPTWALRTAKAETPTVVFALPGPHDDPPTVGEGYRHAQITLALAMMVALADGTIDPAEQRALFALIGRLEGVTDDERGRLTAEMRAQAADPHALSDLRSRLKALPVEVRTRLADEIVAIAGADGVIDPREVTLLEKLFRQIDADASTLYARLHMGVAGSDEHRASGETAPTLASVSAPATPPSGSRSSAINHERLAAIRRETAGITSVLSEIFADDEPSEIPPVAGADVETADDQGGLDGLDRRHRSLVVEILERPEWPKDDFDRLVRGVGLMPGAAIETLNDWAFERFDECLLEGEDPIVANAHLVPHDLLRVTA